LTHLVRTRRIAPPHNVDALLLGKKHHRIRGHGVIGKGFYYRQLMAYARLFNRSQMLVLIFEEDVARTPDEGLRRTCEFLEIRPKPAQSSKAVHQNASRRSLPRLMADFYFPPVRPVSRLIDTIVPAWKPTPTGRALDELYQTYAAENEKLFRWLGRPMPRSWEKKEDFDAGMGVTEELVPRGRESKMARSMR
jgi:hypothetical protein